MIEAYSKKWSTVSRTTAGRSLTLVESHRQNRLPADSYDGSRSLSTSPGQAETERRARRVAEIPDGFRPRF